MIFILSLAEKAIERGVMPDYDSREPWFLCYEHSDADIDETLECVCGDCERSEKVIISRRSKVDFDCLTFN